MGNPFIFAGDRGDCLSCEHFRGLHTQDKPPIWVLCGYRMQTFSYEITDPERGCKYFQAREEATSPAR